MGGGGPQVLGSGYVSWVCFGVCFGVCVRGYVLGMCRGIMSYFRCSFGGMFSRVCFGGKSSSLSSFSSHPPDPSDPSNPHPSSLLPPPPAHHHHKFRWARKTSALTTKFTKGRRLRFGTYRCELSRGDSVQSGLQSWQSWPQRKDFRRKSRICRHAT